MTTGKKPSPWKKKVTCLGGCYPDGDDGGCGHEHTIQKKHIFIKLVYHTDQTRDFLPSVTCPQCGVVTSYPDGSNMFPESILETITGK